MSRLPRVPLEVAQGGERPLERKTAHYLTEVLRLSVGDPFVAFDPDARVEADARLLSIGREARIALGEPRLAQHVVHGGIVLLQAVGKGDKVEQVIRHATALGVAEVEVVECARSVARSGERAETWRARWRACALDAARQSGRGDCPLLSGPLAFEPALARAAARAGRKLCLAPGAEHTLKSATDGWRASEPLQLLIGPEGGLSERELEQARLAGFTLVRFGELVLRTELCGVAVLGALNALGEA